MDRVVVGDTAPGTSVNATLDWSTFEWQKALVKTLDAFPIVAATVDFYSDN